MIPGVRETPATIDGGASRGCARPARCSRRASSRGSVADLRPAVDDFASSSNGQIELLPVFDLFNRCQSDVVLPSGETVIARRRAVDRAEELQGVPAGAGQGFGGRPAELQRQRHLHPLPARRRRLPGPDGHRRPAPPADAASATPPRRRSARARRAGPSRPTSRKAPCHKQGVPNLNAAQDRGRPVSAADHEAAARSSWRWSCCSSARSASAAYILSHQRFYLPAWVPGVGTDFYEVKAELPTAQAVVPGPGPDRERGRREGRRGRRGQPRERPRRRADADQGQVRADLQDATSCCGPKTGLKDMILELDPGTPWRGRARRRAAGSPSPTRCPT